MQFFNHYYRFFALLFFCLALTTMGASLYAIYSFESDKIHERYTRIIAEEGRLLHDTFTDHIAYATNIVLSLRQSRVLNRAFEHNDTAVLQDLFYQHATLDSAIMQLRLIDAKGDERVRVDRDCFDTPPHILRGDRLQNKAHRYYFRATMARHGDVYISDLDLNIEHGRIETPHKPTLRIAASDAQQRYMIIINLFMKPFLNKLQSPFYYVYLLDVSGRFLLHPEPEKSWGSILDHNTSVYQEFPREAETILLNTGMNAVGYVTALGIPNGQGLRLLLRPRTDFLKEELQDVARLLFIVLICSLPVILLFEFLLLRTLRKLNRQEVRLRELMTIINQIDDHILIADPRGSIRYINDAVRKTTGYANGELLKQNPSILKSGFHPPEFYEKMWQTLRGGKPFRGLFRNRSKDGRIYYLDETITPVFDFKKKLIAYVASGRDITERMQMEESIRKSEAVFRTLSDHSASGIFMFSDHHIIYANDSFRKIIRCQDRDIASIDFRKLISEENKKPVLERLDTFLNDPIPDPEGSFFEIALKCPDAHLVWVQLGLIRTTLYGEECVIGTANNIDDMILRHNKLKQMAVTDQLTGAFNRHSFIENFAERFDTFRQADEPFSLMLFDIDNFKEINDTYGHDVGDQVLREVASIARETIRKTDFLVRWGGEEFVIVLQNSTAVVALRLAEQIRRKIASHTIVPTGPVTASFGIAQLAAADNDIADVVNRADQAMYAAKKSGKNQSVIR